MILLPRSYYQGEVCCRPAAPRSHGPGRRTDGDSLLRDVRATVSAVGVGHEGRVTMGRTAPEIRPAGPDDLEAVVGLLTDVFLTDPLMSVIAAAAPSPRTALEHLHRVELADRYQIGRAHV